MLPRVVSIVCHADIAPQTWYQLTSVRAVHTLEKGGKRQGCCLFVVSVIFIITQDPHFLHILTFGFICSFARSPYDHLQAIRYFYFGQQALIQWALALNTHPFQWQLQILTDNVWDGKSVTEAGNVFCCQNSHLPTPQHLCILLHHRRPSCSNSIILCNEGISYGLRYTRFLSFYANINLVHGLNSLLIGTLRREWV